MTVRPPIPAANVPVSVGLTCTTGLRPAVPASRKLAVGWRFLARSPLSVKNGSNTARSTTDVSRAISRPTSAARIWKLLPSKMRTVSSSDRRTTVFGFASEGKFLSGGDASLRGADPSSGTCASTKPWTVQLARTRASAADWRMEPSSAGAWAADGRHTNIVQAEEIAVGLPGVNGLGPSIPRHRRTRGGLERRSGGRAEILE